MSAAVEADPVAVWQAPRLNAGNRILTGTASGIATEVGIGAVYVRVLFLVLTLAGGWGAVLYFGAWLFMRRQPHNGYDPVPKGESPTTRMLGVALISLGLLLMTALFGTTFPAGIVWPAALLGTGLAVALDGGEWARRGLTELARPEYSAVRVVAGLGCLFVGVIVALALSLSPTQAISGIAVAGMVLVGAGIVFAPTIRRMGAELLDERRLRIRSEERAEVAAHLHDSVLQTLTLIQKQSGDASVVGLARQQERELRSWLFDEKALKPNLGFRNELERLMGDVEARHQVPIEVVVVGDTQVDEPVAGLLAAIREATINAAKHSKANRIDVFAEIGAGSIEVFVRDQGVGFDPELVDESRAGIRGSIVGRMERLGGSATIWSKEGDGTEVELVLPIEAANAVNAPEEANRHE